MISRIVHITGVHVKEVPFFFEMWERCLMLCVWSECLFVVVVVLKTTLWWNSIHVNFFFLFIIVVFTKRKKNKFFLEVQLKVSPFWNEKVKKLKVLTSHFLFFSAFKRHETFCQEERRKKSCDRVLWNFEFKKRKERKERKEWNWHHLCHLSDPPITQENEKTNKQTWSQSWLFQCECILLFLTWRERWPVFWMKKQQQQQHNFLLTLSHSHMVKLKPDELAMQSQKKKKKKKGHQLYEQSWQSVPMIACWCQLVNEVVCLFVVLSAFSKLLAEFHLFLSTLLQGSCWHACHEFPMCFPQSQSSSLFARMKMTITVQTIDLIFLVKKKKATECVFLCWVEVIVMFNTQVVFFVVLILKEKGGKYSHSHQ